MFVCVEGGGGASAVPSTHASFLPPPQVVAIEGLENILRHRPPAGHESYLVFMEEAGVPAALEELMAAETTTTSAWTKADAFMQAHFPHYSHFAGREEEEEEEDAEEAEEGAVGAGGQALSGFFGSNAADALIAMAAPQQQQQPPQAQQPFAFGGGFNFQ